MALCIRACISVHSCMLCFSVLIYTKSEVSKEHRICLLYQPKLVAEALLIHAIYINWHFIGTVENRY